MANISSITLPDGSSYNLKDSVSGYVTQASLTAWNLIKSTTGTTAATNLGLTNYNEVMIVADVLRNSAYHMMSVVVPTARLSTTEREVKLSGGEGLTTSVNCGAWGKLTTAKFTPVGAYINNTAYASSTTWYIYGR